MAGTIAIKFLDLTGALHDVSGQDGESLMEAAKRQGVPGIDADCGGAASCGTCQVIVGNDWRVRIPEMDDTERDMLEFASLGEEGCRLSCQIKLSDALNGLEVKVAET